MSWQFHIGQMVVCILDHPSSSDDKFGRRVEADADVVMFLYREAYYIEKSAEFKAGEPEAQLAHEAVAHKLEMIIPKNRNGPTGAVTLFCDIGASAIRNAEHHYGER